jgi:hypothetical protein
MQREEEDALVLGWVRACSGVRSCEKLKHHKSSLKEAGNWFFLPEIRFSLVPNNHPWGNFSPNETIVLILHYSCQGDLFITARLSNLFETVLIVGR